MPVQVFVLDDHELIRRALIALLAEQDDLELTGEAATVKEGLAAMFAAPPDVAIVDLRLPDGSGVEVCRELRSKHPDTRCLILTSSTDEEAVMGAVLAGAAGFLIKDATGAQILDAIREVARGNSLLDPAVTGSVMARLRDAEDGGGRGGESSPLTTQEEHILELLAEGLTNRQMSERLHLAEKTVRNYVSNLLAKLGLEHRTAAALYAMRRRKDPPGGYE